MFRMTFDPVPLALTGVVLLAALTGACSRRLPTGATEAPATQADASVTSIAHATGLTDGRTLVTILGSGFRPGLTVTLGGTPATSSCPCSVRSPPEYPLTTPGRSMS